MEAKFKQIIKEAVLEALSEFAGQPAIMSLDAPITGAGSGTGTNTSSESGNNSGGNNSGNNGGNNSGQGGGSVDNSGGTPSEDGRPKPDVGVGVWSRR